MYNEGKVSIIVPVYNAENFLHRTVDSILAQTYENWELLLADDCSTDQSRDIMKSYTDERIHCFYCEKNSGPAGARNLALRHASGQYVAFLDADDFWLPQKLEKQISFIKKEITRSALPAMNLRMQMPSAAEQLHTRRRESATKKS